MIKRVEVECNTELKPRNCSTTISCWTSKIKSDGNIWRLGRNGLKLVYKAEHSKRPFATVGAFAKQLIPVMKTVQEVLRQGDFEDWLTLQGAHEDVAAISQEYFLGRRQTKRVKRDRRAQEAYWDVKVRVQQRLKLSN